MGTKRAKVTKGKPGDGQAVTAPAPAMNAREKARADTDQRVAQAIEKMATDGMHAAMAYGSLNIPAGTFYEAVRRNRTLAKSYARARKIVLAKMADDLLTIADDGSNDTYLDENGNVRTDSDVVQRSRLRVDTRKFLLAKLAPRRFGDKVEVDHKGGVTETRRVIIDAAGLSDEQRAVLGALAAGPKPQLPPVDTTARDPGYTPTSHEVEDYEEPVE